MALNKILHFAGDVDNANVLTQAEYEVDPQRTLGNQPGVARSKLVNKAMRQASVMAAGVAQFLADNQGYDIDDELTPAQVSNAFALAFINGLASLITTRPQFDDTENIATTEFVQRALGNYADSVIVAGPLTLDSSHIGKLMLVNGYTITLPAVSSVVTGASFHIRNVSTIPVKVTTTTNTVFFYSGEARVDVYIQPGDTLTVTSGFGTWVASGTASLQLSKAFNYVLNQSGWQRLPTGLIIQWGEITTSGSGGVTLTYPIAFPTGVLSGHMELKSTPGISALHTGMDFSGASTTSMTVYSRDASTNNYLAGTFKYFLIGY